MECHASGLCAAGVQHVCCIEWVRLASFNAPQGAQRDRGLTASCPLCCWPALLGKHAQHDVWYPFASSREAGRAQAHHDSKVPCLSSRRQAPQGVHMHCALTKNLAGGDAKYIPPTAEVRRGRRSRDYGLLVCGEAATARRGPEEADAETVRVGVLLDELDFPGERPCSAHALDSAVDVGLSFAACIGARGRRTKAVLHSADLCLRPKACRLSHYSTSLYLPSSHTHT